MKNIFLRQDDQKVPVIINYKSQPALYEGEPVFAVSMLDLSGIKAQEKALTEEKDFWHFIFERAPVGMAIFDAKGRYYMVNETVCHNDRQTLLDPHFDWKVLFPDSLQESIAQ